MADQEKKTMKIRFRRTVSLGGVTYQANTLASVEATDEAWDLVNRGEADLEPGPGVDGQPFPPEDVTRDETTDVPVPGAAPATPPKPAPPKRGTKATETPEATRPQVPGATSPPATESEPTIPRTEPAPNPRVERAEPATAPPHHEEPSSPGKVPPTFTPPPGKHRR